MPWRSLVARLAEVVLEARAWAARGGFTTKIHLSADGCCRPLSRVDTPGQRADYAGRDFLVGRVSL